MIYARYSETKGMSEVKYSLLPEENEQTPRSERRAHLEFVRKDRRVIERLRDPQLRFMVRQVHRVCDWWVKASLAYVSIMVGTHVYNDYHTSQKSTFFAVVILTLTYAVRQVGMAAASYVETESQARIEKFVERVYHLLFTATTVSAILGGSYLLSLF